MQEGPTMKFRHILILPALFLAAGCASFNSGDVMVSRSHLHQMMDAKDIKPAGEIRLVWKNFPYKSAIDTIGEGSTRAVRPRPLPVPVGDMAWLKKHAGDIFEEAGLYDARNGSGTITIALTSYGRWTYGEIFRSFLVDTGYIFLIPASLRVNHQLVVEYNGHDGRAAVEEIGQNKTTFHALILPLYPLFSPGRKEHALIKNMLWKSAVDVYLKVKRGEVSAGTKQPAVLNAEPEEQGGKPGADELSGPPVAPDRTWLPENPAGGAPKNADGTQGIEPDKPDNTWVVPTKDAPAGKPFQDIKPEPADRDWKTNTSSASVTPDD